MNNACILLKNRISIEEGGENALLTSFSRCGYPVKEIRILPLEESKIMGAITSLEKEYENIFVFAPKSGLPLAGGVLSSLPSTTRIREYAGAGIYQKGKTSLFLLSNDNAESGEGFFQVACKEYLQSRSGTRYESTVLRAVGANESRVRALIAEGEKRVNGKVRFVHTRKYDEDVLELLYDESAPKVAVDTLVRLFADELQDTVYSMEDIRLEERLVQLLKLRGKKLSVAESFTGGGIAKRITSVSGASEVYFEGLNTYAEGAKTARLGVSQYLLRTAGAVSDQTAYEMALGLLNSGNCDLAIATTGLAGPNTDRSALPVGLCFIAVGTREKIYVYRYKFDGDRKEITEKAINYALFSAYKILKNL